MTKRTEEVTQPLIEFTDFTFQYREQKYPTLHNINLRIKAGERILIAGPSGSGKSTLGSCLNGLVPFNSKGIITGSLQVNGTKPKSIFQMSELVGTVLQDTDGQFIGLSSGEDIAFALENKSRPLDEMRERVRKAAQLVGADGYLSHAPSLLSGGQKQRVSMAGILIENVPILLLDEPLAALDPVTGKRAIALIDEIATRTGCTVIIIEHRIEDVLKNKIDRVILLNEGRIIADCSPDEIVISEKLVGAGIRKPLYILALERSGVSLTREHQPGSLDSISLSENEKKHVRSWMETVKQNNNLPSNISHTDTPLLEAQNIRFSYTNTDTVALDDVSFKLYAGEMTAIVGANGAGKSTLAKVIVGFEQLKAGNLLYNGEDMTGLTIPERAMRIGYVMQNPNHMICKPLIYDEVALGLRVRGYSENEISQRIDHVLEICGLTRFRNWPISALSYGQKKRVTIADALALEPQMIILDEPTAGQDWRHYTEIMEFLVSLNQHGITVLLITHDMHLCLEYAKRSLVFTDGKLIADCPAYKVLADPVMAAKANLRETSLYDFSRICGIDDTIAFIQAYLDT